MVTERAVDDKVQPRAGKIALITGANVGIGKDVARQLALTGTYERIYLACRNPAKADLARQGLERSTGKRSFEIVLMDVSDPASVRSLLASLPEPIDALVMNAGGSGGKTPLAVGKHGVTAIFASNLLGHIVLLEGLIDAGKLRGTALLVGSEAARGVPKLGMKRPSLPTSSTDEFASLCDGTFFRDREADGRLAYGQVKYVGAMWMAAVARRNPELRLLTISPGNTRGTEGLRDLPQPLRFLMKYVLAPVILPLRGMIHDLDQGAKRLVDGLADDTFASGAFYASKADALIGPMVDQSEIFPDLANTVYQDHAYEAVHRFI